MKIHEILQNPIEKMDIFSNEHNFATIGSILEILDVLNSSDRVLANFDTFVR